jgi:ribosomal protein S18 acetylase RimI-like enzyme
VALPAGFYIREMNEGDLSQVLALEGSTFPSPWTEDLFLHELRRGPDSMYMVVLLSGCWVISAPSCSRARYT